MRLNVLLTFIFFTAHVLSAQKSTSVVDAHSEGGTQTAEQKSVEPNIMLIAANTVSPAANSKKTSTPAKKKGPVKILFSRAVDASLNPEDHWFAALTEAVLEYKCAAIGDLKMVSPDVTKKHMPQHGDFSVTPEDMDYMDLGKKLRCDYVGIQKFEVARGRNVFYYMEITDVSSQEIVSTIERNFKLKKLGTELDEIINLIMKELKIIPPREMARFLRIPAFDDDLRSAKALGNIIVKERFSKATDSLALAADYREICEKERNFHVAYYRAGFLFLAVGKYNDASEAFNLLFLTLPEYLPVYVPLARAFRKAHRFEDAVRIGMLGDKRGLVSSELNAEKALAYLEMGKPNEAEKSYKQILAKNPEDPYALLFYARLNNDKNHPKQALEYVTRLLKTGEHTGSAYLEQGRSYVLQKQTKEAITSLSKAVSMLPNEIEPVIYLGDAQFTAKKYKDALALYEKALTKVSDKVDLYIRAAQAADRSGNRAKALSILKNIEGRFSNHGGLQKELGLLYIANGDSAKARVHLEAGMRSGLEDDRVLVGLGWIYVNSGEPDKARTMFNKALKTVKDKNQCKVGLAMVAIKKGETKKAAELIKEVTAAKLSIPGINGMLGDAMLAKKENRSALVYFRKEQKLTKDDKGLQTKIADLSYELEPASTARKEYRQLLKMGGTGARTLYRLGILSLKLKDTKNAKDYLDRAQKAGDTDADNWLAIGKGYAALGQKKEALDAFNRCAQKKPSNDEVWSEILKLQKRMGNDSGAAEAHLKLYGIDAKKYEKNLVTAGNLFEKAGLKAKAKSTYATFIRNKHVDANVNIRLAIMEFEEQKYTSVVTLLKDIPAITLGTKYGMILGESYFRTKQYEKSLPILKFVLSKSPKNKQALEWAALASEYTKQYDYAIKMYQKYLIYAGKHKDYAYHLGELIETHGKKASAIAQYRANTRNYPSDPRNFNKLAEIYVEAKNWNNAITMLEKAMAFENASPRIMGLLARANLALGRKKTAMKHLKNYIESAPNDSSAWYELGSLQYENKEFSEAAKALIRAAKLMRRPSADIYKKIGFCFLAINDTSQATGFFENARTIDKTDMELLSLLAVCYRSTNNTRQLAGILYNWLKLDPENDKVRLELAEVYIAESKYNDATRLIEEALVKRKCDVELHLKLAKIYEKQNDDKKWLVHLQAASQCNPKDVELLYQIGRYYFEKKNRLQGERYLKRALRLNKRHTAANFMYGSIVLARKEYKKAGVFLSRAVAIDRENEDYRVALTEAFYQQGRYDDAFKAIKPLIRKGDIRPDALRWAGLIYSAIGKPDTAKQILENAIQVERKCSECYIALGDIHFNEADFRNAIDYYQRAFNLDGFSRDAANKLAHSYMKIGKEDKAEGIYREILAKNPGDGEALYRVVHGKLKNDNISAAKSIIAQHRYNKDGWYYLSTGEISEKEKNIKAALSAFGRALRLIPEVPEVQAGCGRISLAKRKYKAAIKYFGVAMAGAPEDPNLMLGMGQAYEGRGDRMTALDLYKEVIKQDPENSDVYYYMARIHSKAKDHEMAIQMLEDGIKHDRKNPLLFLALGHEYRIMQNTSEAIDNYLKAVRLDEKRAIEAYRHIGNIYYRSRNEKKAKKYYEIYIKLGGKNKKVRRYINSLQ